MSTRRNTHLLAGTLVLAFAVAGCTGDDGTDEPSGATPSASASASASDVAATFEMPQTPAGEQAAWLISVSDPQGPEATVEDVEERFSESLLEQGADQLLATIQAVRAQGPYPATEVLQDTGDTVVLRVDSEPLYLMTVVVADGTITQWNFVEDKSEVAASITDLASWDTTVAEEYGGTTQTYVAELTGGACQSVYSTEGAPEGGEPAPAASMAKLAVLAVVVDAVESGDLTWEDELTITPEVKSLPSGELQNRPDGDTVTVREAADLMISISDNTATDMLIDAVGRDRIEATLPDLGVADPHQLTPFLKTRELFLLGYAAPEIREQWPDADPAEREELLTQLPGDLASVDLATLPFDPVWDEGIDWFFSGGELCSVMAGLLERSGTAAGEHVLDILSIEPGLEVPDGVTYQGFKGGSVTGMVGATVLSQTDDRWFVYVTQIVSESPVEPSGSQYLISEGNKHAMELVQQG